MRNSESNKRNYIIIGLCAVALIMSVGFAVFSQQLQINSTSEVTGSWCLGFDNTMANTYVATPGVQTGIAPTGIMTYGGSTCGEKSQTGVTLASNLKQPGDSIEYTLTILNEGSLDAAIKSILVDSTEVTSDQTITKGNVKYQIEMPISTSIAANSSTTMKVTVSFQNETDITKSVNGENSSIEVKINAEQDDGNGGFTPSQNTFTGTIYTNTVDTTMTGDNKITIGDSIVPVSETKWCEVGTFDGEPSNSCADYNRGHDSQSECENELADSISSGEIQQGDITCELGTVTTRGIGEYTTSQSEIQNQTNYYLKHTVVNDIITENYVCFVNDKEYCLQGGSSEYFSSNTFIIQGLETFFTERNGSCTFDNSTSKCKGSSDSELYELSANSDGSVKLIIKSTNRPISYLINSSGQATINYILLPIEGGGGIY